MKIDLAPLADLIADRVILKLEARETNSRSLNGQLAYPEDQAARMLGIPKNSLRERRLAGDIAARKVGKRYLYPRAALLEFLSE